MNRVPDRFGGKSIILIVLGLRSQLSGGLKRSFVPCCVRLEVRGGGPGLCFQPLHFPRPPCRSHAGTEILVWVLCREVLGHTTVQMSPVPGCAHFFCMGLILATETG